MRQILTIFSDSYRLLRAKKLFWVALSFSILIALLYASISIGEHGMSFLFGAYSLDGEGYQMPPVFAKLLYLTIFTEYMVPFWLGLFAIVLALISVSSVFPNFLEGGAIDIAVSKPISRVTLFFAKYVSSLLFVAIQVFVFCVIVFIAFGLRMESWNFGIFWAVPLIVFVFSMIYSVAVLMAVWTKSTLLSLFISLLVWGISWAVHGSESLIYRAAYTTAAQGRSINYETGESEVSDEPQEADAALVKVHRGVKMAGVPLPKTRDTTYFLNKLIKIDGKDLTQKGAFEGADMDNQTQNALDSIEDYENRHSVGYVIGTSLAFEAVMLSLACFIFVRRDY